VTEAELSEQVRAACQRLGLLHFHPYDSRRSQPGFPDWTILGGSLLFAELKSATGTLASEQQAWRYRLQAAGQRWVLWRPEHWQSGEIIRTLWALAQPPAIATEAIA
jgi:hypothetical protein